MKLSYASINSRGMFPAVVRLPGETLPLLLDVLDVARERYEWEGLTDTEWQAALDLVEKTLAAIMTDMLTGTIIFSAAGVPDGCLLCDGSSYTKAEFPALYAALDAIYITDADNFTVPDLIGKFPLGSSDTGFTGGAETVTLSETEMPPHTHGYLTPTINIDVESVGVPDPSGVGLPLIPVYQTSSAGGGQAHNNMPPYLEVVPCIVAF